MDESEIKKFYTLQNDWIEEATEGLDDWKINSFYTRHVQYKKMPLIMIPEIKLGILSKMVDWKEFQQQAPNANRYDDPVTLANHLVDMKCSMKFEYQETRFEIKRGKWTIIFDDYNEIYWKIDGDIEDILIEVFTNYLLND